MPDLGPCACRSKPKSKPKGKLHLNKVLYLSWKNGFTFIFSKLRKVQTRLAGMRCRGASSHRDNATQPAPLSKTIRLLNKPAIVIFGTRASLRTHLSTDDERR